MKPKGKAKELVEKFEKGIRAKVVCTNNPKYGAKQCALIAVDSHLSSIEVQTGDTTKIIEVDYIQKMYWQEVKNEIEKI